MHVDIIWLNGTSDAEYISVILYCDPKTAASMACHTTCPTKLSATPKRPLSDTEVGSPELARRRTSSDAHRWPAFPRLTPRFEGQTSPDCAPLHAVCRR